MQRLAPALLLFLGAGFAFASEPAEARLFGHHHATPPVRTAAAGSGPGGVLRAINTERAHGRLAPVALDARTSGVAQAYANDMARRGFFGHVSPEGVDPFTRMRRAGIVFHAAGENIGFGRDLATAERAIYGDAAHRAIVLGGRFRRVGLGSARANTNVIIVEDFTD